MLWMQKKVILASKSPRRKQLLAQAGFTFTTSTAHASEDYPEHLPLINIPQFIAKHKAAAVANLPSTSNNTIIIAADTIVAHNNIVYGKPNNHQQAYQMISALSNQWHQVITGVCLCHTASQQTHTFAELAEVKFTQLTDKMINHYIEQYKPYDKAGGYGIQEWIGLVGVEQIKGCFFNIMGLPVSRLVKEFETFATATN